MFVVADRMSEPSQLHAKAQTPTGPVPDPSGDVPWYMRYTLPVAVLAIVALVLFAGWLFTL